MILLAATRKLMNFSTISVTVRNGKLMKVA